MHGRAAYFFDLVRLCTHVRNHRTLATMVETIALLLIVLWLFGMLTSYTLGGPNLPAGIALAAPSPGSQ